MERKKWEYDFVKTQESAPAKRKMLAEMGQNGWELVCVVDSNIFYFKREQIEAVDGKDVD